MERPYLDIVDTLDFAIREFSQEIDPTELKWHRDNEYRTIVSENLTNWMIQLDNELPVSLNNTIEIPKHKWHRLIKGTGNLTLKIKKN